MLQIRLSKGPTAESGGGVKSLPVETVTCPEHLVLADLPVAKSLGSVTAASLVKTVGRRSRRHLGERVHFCVRCDFPIAIYGRLSPCEHAFCLDCARSDSICYLCDERIQKIQTIKMMEGIFICAAPHCLKSFLKRTEFESHIHENHGDLLQQNVEKEDGNDSEVQSMKQPTPSDSSVKASLRATFSSSSHAQSQDREDRAHRQPVREPSRLVMQPRLSPVFGHPHSSPSEPPSESRPPGFERPSSSPQRRFQQQGIADTQGGQQQESAQCSDLQQGILSDTPIPTFVVPINSNPPFSYPSFAPDVVQPFFGTPYEMARQESAPEGGPEQGSLLGFPPGPVAAMNFSEGYQRSWNVGPTGSPFETPVGGQGTGDGFTNSSDPQRGTFYPGNDYGRSPGPGVSPFNTIPPAVAHKGMEPLQGSNALDLRDTKGILAPQPSTLPPPPPLPPHALHNQGKFYSSDVGRDGQGFGWQHEKRNSFGSGQD